jgi:hypothetical protein
LMKHLADFHECNVALAVHWRRLSLHPASTLFPRDGAAALHYERMKCRIVRPNHGHGDIGEKEEHQRDL